MCEQGTRCKEFLAINFITMLGLLKFSREVRDCLTVFSENALPKRIPLNTKLKKNCCCSGFASSLKCSIKAKWFWGNWAREGSTLAIVLITSAKVRYLTCAPPNCLGTVMAHRPLCENCWISFKGKRRSLSRSDASWANSWASCLAISIASSSERIICASLTARIQIKEPLESAHRTNLDWS